MENLHFVYNVKTKEEIAKHILLMNLSFNFDQVYSNINTNNSSATIITRSQKMSLAFDHYTSPGGHAGITDTMLSYIYPNYQRSKIYGDEKVYFDNLDNNVFILTMKSFLVLLIPSQITEFQYNGIITYINEFKNSEYAKENKIKDFFINDDMFPFEEIDKRTNMLKDRIAKLPTLEEYPFSEITNEEDINNFINKYYQNNKVR